MQKEANREEEAAIGAKCIDHAEAVPEPQPEGFIKGYVDKKARNLFDPEYGKRVRAWGVSDYDDLAAGLVWLFIMTWGLIASFTMLIVAPRGSLRGLLAFALMFGATVVVSKGFSALVDRYWYERAVWRHGIEHEAAEDLFEDVHIAGKLRSIATEAPFDPHGHEGLRDDERAAIRAAADRLEAREGSE